MEIFCGFATAPLVPCSFAKITGCCTSVAWPFPVLSGHIRALENRGAASQTGVHDPSLGRSGADKISYNTKGSFSRSAIHQRNCRCVPDRTRIMSETYQNTPFSLLPDRRPPWKEFVLTMGLQGAALFLLAWATVFNLAVLDSPDPRLPFHSPGGNPAGGEP